MTKKKSMKVNMIDNVLLIKVLREIEMKRYNKAKSHRKIFKRKSGGGKFAFKGSHINSPYPLNFGRSSTPKPKIDIRDIKFVLPEEYKQQKT